MRKTVLTALAAVLLTSAPVFASAAYGDDAPAGDSSSTTATQDLSQQDPGLAPTMGEQSDVLRPGADPDNPNDYPYLPAGMQPPADGPRTDFPQAPQPDGSSTGTVATSNTVMSPNVAGGSATTGLPDIAVGKPYTFGTQWPDTTFHKSDLSHVDAGQLTDGLIAPLSFGDKGWLNLLRQYGRSVIVNLGDQENVRRVSFDFLQNLGAGIDFPDSVTYYASNDGVNWYSLGTAWSVKGAGDLTPQTQDYPVDTNVNAQYIRAQFETKVWAFFDEFSVFGSPQPAKGAKPLVGNGQDLTDTMGSGFLVDPNVSRVQGGPPSTPAVTPPPNPPGEKLPYGYEMSSEPSAGGIKNMQLVYTGANGALGEWSQSDFMPMIAQEDADGNPTGWLFDASLFIQYNALSTSASWTAWLNDLFAPNVQLSALDQSVGALKQKLNDPNFKEKVIISIPGLVASPSNFGSIDASGQNLDMNPADVGQQTANDNKLKAIQWFIDQSVNQFNSANYQNLSLAGFYWQPESLTASLPLDAQLIQAAADAVHRTHGSFYWIPYYGAPGITEWHQLGFDAVMIQPGVSFNWSIPAQQRFQSTTDQAKYYHTGIEIEQHWNVTSGNAKTALTAQNKYNDYFTAGNVFGYEGDVLKSYYLNSKTLVTAYQSANPFYHQVYDNTVQFVNRQWTGTTFQ